MFHIKLKSFVKGALILTASLLLAACGSKEEPKTTTSPSSQTTDQVVTSTPPGTTTAPPATSSQPTGPVLAKLESNTPGVRFEIYELKHTAGDTVTLKFALVNDSNQTLNHWDIFSGNDVEDVVLVDIVGKKKYFVVKDEGGYCLCSRNIKDVNPHSRANLWAKFPAPPEDVQKISVIIEPNLTPIDDVPISR